MSEGESNGSAYQLQREAIKTKKYYEELLESEKEKFRTHCDKLERVIRELHLGNQLLCTGVAESEKQQRALEIEILRLKAKVKFEEARNPKQPYRPKGW